MPKFKRAVLYMLAGCGVSAETVAVDMVQLAADIRPGSGSSTPTSLVVFRDKLYFAATEGVSGIELWSYDGSVATRVADFNPGPPNSNPTDLFVWNDTLYLGLNDGVHGQELWRFDGVSFEMAADHLPGSESSAPTSFAEYRGNLYYWARDASGALHLWRFNGWTAVVVADQDPADTSRSRPAVFQGALYFYGYDPVHGSELWKYDGATASFVAEVCPGPLGSSIREMTIFQDALYFIAFDCGARHGNAVWRFNGTDLEIAADVNPSADNTIAEWPAVFNQRLHFAADDWVVGQELWQFDGASAALAADVNPTGNGEVEWLTVFDGDLYMSAQGSTASGLELWKFDGVSATLIRDIYLGPSNGTPEEFEAYNGRLYFSANDGIAGRELWQLEDPVSDNCPLHFNPDQADTDGDGAGDICDCRPADASAFAVPMEVASLRIGPGRETLVWASVADVSGTGSTYDVLRGMIGEFPVGSSAEFCLAPGLTQSTVDDTSEPLSGEGYWYLVRARNACGVGTYGFQSNGAERQSTVCP